MATETRSRSFFKSKPFLIITGLVVITLVVLGGLWMLGRSSLQAELAALRAKGLPTTASEVNDFYSVPDEVADTTDLWIKAIDAVGAADLETRGTALPFVGQGPTPIPDSIDEWAEYEAARELLADLETELTAIRQAAAAGGQARFPVDFSAGINTQLPYTQAVRNVARLLTLDAHVSARNGNPSQALEDIKAIFALSDALRGEPIVISQLVRLAIHATGLEAVQELLPLCSWSDDELESIQSAIRSARYKEELASAFCGERAVCLTAMAAMPLGPFRQTNAIEALRLFERSLDGFAKPWPEALSRQHDISRQLIANNRSTLNRIRLAGVLLLMPALETAATAGARAEARRRCAVAALAVERLRRQKREIPNSLAAIDPALFGSNGQLSTEFVDPFNGDPLRYMIEETRIVIYSVGDNGQDDGGACQPDDQNRLLDVGFELKK